MLSNLSEDVANCYRRAAECQELARLATNDKDREFYLAREKEWLLFGGSHLFQERMDQAIEEVDRWRGVTVMRACPACRKATPSHYPKLLFARTASWFLKQNMTAAPAGLSLLLASHISFELTNQVTQAIRRIFFRFQLVF